MDGCSAKNALTASIRRTSWATWSSSRPSSALAATSASRGSAAAARAARALRGERLVADDDHPLRAERQRGRDRRVQPRRAVDVVARRRPAARSPRPAGRAAGSRPTRARAGPRAACARTGSRGPSAAAAPRSRRTRPAAPRSSEVATTQTACISAAGDVGVQRVPVDPALEAARQRRGIEQRRGAQPRQLEHLARQPQQPERRCRRRSPAEITLALAHRAPVLEERLAPARARGSAATAATTAALIPPTLVPHTISTRSPRASSAGIRTDSAPAS